MRIPFQPATHRLRLSLLAALYSGVILALMFYVAGVFLRRFEIQRSFDVLRPAAQQAIEVYHERPLNANWSELTIPNPSISIAVFDKNNELLDFAGSLVLEPVSGHGLKAFKKQQATFFARNDSDGHLIVVALPWSSKQAQLDRERGFLVYLWAFLVVAAGVVTWTASRSTFEPLAQLAEQAEQLSATDLSRRLTLVGAGEFAVVARHLNRFLELLEASVQRQERFVSDAAHELRTPLTVIRGQIETALLRARKPEDYRHTLEVSLAEAERLSRLVEGLLLSASAPVVQPSPVELEMVLESAQARWLDRYSKAGIELEVGEIPCAKVVIRAEECDSILDNLLSNALKHSDSGTKTRLWATVDDQFGTLWVADQGAGIPEALKETLFDRFSRGDTSRNRELGGFGIGLAVVKRLVQARGGDVWLEPSDRGATFAVKLPSGTP
ncbi:MAG TPA: HAMP domain-containing sensor histidine kinase [Fimbriimonadaceae bacterium]|nr:HAMP domain-containing sensor histidine kinase [Fimbriimonadaceae bacterium]